MPSEKCKIFQSTYLGNEKDGNWDNMMRTIADGKQPFKYIDRLQIAFADIIATDPDYVHLEYKMSEEYGRPRRKQENRIRKLKSLRKWDGQSGYYRSSKTATKCELG